MDMEKVDQIVDNHNCEASSLIQILLNIQSENHWLPTEAMERVAEKLDVPSTRVQQIATFYKAFSLVPQGRHAVHVCMGTACHVRGAQRVLDAIEDLTGIKPGETDLDMRYSLEIVNCLGCCSAGPVADIDGTVHTDMTPANTAETLKKYE